ncbi:MAG: RsmE family RNA methyltransferase [Proteobacteria bacterium]|nr:RsmE family RNA methyltransferase [Pseudomonadota bacterium]
MILINYAQPGHHRLGPEPSHHLVKVLRKRAGDAIECCDGRGSLYAGVIISADTRGCDLEIRDLITRLEPPLARLHLYLAYLKGDALANAIARSVELGMTDVTIIQTQRSQASLTRIGERIPHLERAIAGAVQQCKQLHLPILHAACTFSDALKAQPCAHTILLHPGAPTFGDKLPQGNLAVLIGPEGGFSDEELASARASAVCVAGLGRLILRAETAPLAALAAIQQVRGWA